MTSPQKTKGNAWENTVCKHLTDLYGESFIRVPHSGAYIGGSNQHRKEVLHEGQVRSFKGDIIPGLNFPRFNAECKSYKDFPFHQLFQGTCKTLDGWIEQCLDVADEGDFNIIFMKFNRKGTYTAVPIYPSLNFHRHIEYSYQGQIWNFMDYDLFWQHNAAAVKQLCE